MELRSAALKVLQLADPAAKATEATIGYSVAGDARTLAVPAIEKLAPLPRP